MGCAASSATETTTHQYVVTKPAPNRYPVGGTTIHSSTATSNVVTTQNTSHTTVTVTNLPDASRKRDRKDSSSSSSSSDSDDHLQKQRQQIKDKKVVLSLETLQRYNALSVVISKIERKNVTLKLEENIRLSKDLKGQALKLNEEYKQLQLKMNKELQDVQNLESLASGTNVFRYFESQAQFDTQMSKEQEEYIQAKTEMEDCYKRIIALQTRQSEVSQIIADLEILEKELQAHYQEQDNILDSIFDGSYGSELEDKLERELDQAQERNQRIALAYQRWRNAEAVVTQASGQLNYAYDRWQSIHRISYMGYQNKMLRIQVAAQSRAYLIAASQNLSAGQRLLNTAKFPYCDQQEVETLNKAISYIFIDVQTRERHNHAGHVYRTTRDRCYFLVQWIKHVMATTIQKDLEESRQTCAKLSAQLRAERTKLMREKIEQETGQKVAFDEEPDSGIDTDEEEPTIPGAVAVKEKEDQELDEQIKEAEKDSAEGEEGTTASDDSKPEPLPLDQLAPAPKQDELFGNLETVMAEYDKQREEYSKEIEANRARQHADFQMKLQARRSRKRRMMAQQQELEEMKKREQQVATIEVPTQ